MDQSNETNGLLSAFVTDEQGYTPIENAIVEIASTGNPNEILETLSTNESGQTPTVSLVAPPIEYSMAPSDNQPYSEYTIKVSAKGYETAYFSGIQIFSNEIGLQPVRLTKSTSEFETYNPIVIDGHTLFEYYPPKIAEAEVKPIVDSGEIVLRRVVVPETIVVHDGVPSDSSAKDYYVSYTDYIKNVASCEIYATWPEATLEANILAIMSFTLNRVYTEW